MIALIIEIRNEFGYRQLIGAIYSRILTMWYCRENKRKAYYIEAESFVLFEHYLDHAFDRPKKINVATCVGA